MPSFKDGNDDGVGDFIGITQKIPYLKELGIGAIWLTPFYASPRVDNGYDISDYFTIDHVFGSMDDFSDFIQVAHNAGIRIIVDLVINHTSTAHPWFIESRSAIDSPKRDWYIWKEQPNNWESFFGGTAWEYDELTDAYYYHSFAKEQADLNWANPEVVQSIKEVIKFWLDQGVDGFRLDVINNLTVSSSFPDNPIDESTGEQNHLHDRNQPGIRETLADIQTYITSLNPEAFTVGEISSADLPDIAGYAQDGLFDVTFNFNFGSIEHFSVGKVFQELTAMNQRYTIGRYPTLFFGSHDLGRMWNRLAENNLERYLLLSTLLLTARGIPFIYFGEELGMEDLLQAKREDFRDIQAIMAYDRMMTANNRPEDALQAANRASRDKARAPMNWVHDTFSNVEPWIDYAPQNKERAHHIFTHYQKLIKFRKERPPFEESMPVLHRVEDFIFYQDRHYLIVLNFGPTVVTLPEEDRKRTIYYETRPGSCRPVDNQLTLASQSGAILKLEDEHEKYTTISRNLQK